MYDFPRCIDSRPCFARRPKTLRDKTLVCNCLQSTYENDGACPFCKPVGNVTNGVTYERRKY
jgi:hypothetical protein